MGLFLLHAALVVAPAHAASPGQAALDRGTELYKAGRYPEATLAFQEATRLDPGLLRAWENLGWAYHRGGRHDDALATWSRVLKVEPRHTRLLNEIASVQLGLGQWAAAASFLERSLAADPNQPRIRLRLAESLEKAGQIEGAERAYREVAQHSPKELGPTLRLAEFLERNGHRDAALRVLREARPRLRPYDHILAIRVARLVAWRGDEAYRAGDYRAALAAYDEAVTAAPSVGQYRINRGWAHRQLGAVAEAATDWQAALELDPGRSALYRHIADAALEQEDLDTAAAMYGRAWAESERQPSVPYRLAAIAIEEEHQDDARHWLGELFLLPDADRTWSMRVAALFDDAAQPDLGLQFFEARLPTSAAPEETRRALGRLHAHAGSVASKAGEVATARRELEAALALDPRSGAALRDLGWVYWSLHLWDDCARTWRAYAAAYPDEAQAHSLLARVSLERKDYPTAIAAARESLRLEPDQPSQKLRLAKALFWGGQYAAGRDLAERVARENPDDVASQVLWGELLMQYHDFARGKAQWRHVLDLGVRTPRAEFYWVQSLYELGEYDAALAEARRLVTEEGPKQPLLQFLADDAVRLGQRSEAIRWYAALTAGFPERLPAWLELARLQQEDGDLAGARATLQAAESHHAGRVDIALAKADLDRHSGRSEAALSSLESLAREHPHQREVFQGRVRTALETGRDAEALLVLRAGEEAFLKPYEARMQEARIFVATHDETRAQAALARVIEPPPDTGYVPILLYHGIGDHERSASLPAAQFESQMAALQAAGFTTLTVSELARVASGEATLPERPILVTFDDARLDSFERADPVLARLGMKATMFVPTGRIRDGHPFFADWARIQGFAATGRWDVQSHGHFAHDPISLDAEQDPGSFLVNRQWLPEEARLETHEEYVARLAGDYERSIREIESRFPATRVVGYAFPFSESGQESVGNEPASAETNEAQLERLFRFGFVQDQNGYNEVRPGATLRLLRRFSVPRDFDGEALLRHLALNQPRAAALAESARVHYWAGEYARSRSIWQTLAADEPRLQAEASYYLASIQYERGRYDDARHHLQLAESLGAARLQADPDLARRIRFEGVRVAPRGDFTRDSDGRETEREGIELRAAALGPLEAAFGVGHVALREEGFESLEGRELEASARLGPFGPLSLDGRAWQRSLDGADETLSFNAGLGFESDRFELRLQGGRQDIDTLQARVAGIQADAWGAHSALRVGRGVLASVDAAYDRRDDGNERRDVIGRVTVRPSWGRAVRLGLGAAAGWSDTLLQSPFYYSPEQVRWARGTLSLSRRWGAGWSAEADLGYGLARDALRGERPTFHLQARAGQPWGRNLGSVIEGRYSSSPGYSGWGVGASLEIRVW
jgi:tetratricopeptide (TPR) repeat protein